MGAIEAEDELRHGHLAREQGRADEAAAIYLRIIEGGDAEAVPLAELYLGLTRELQGDVQGARSHYGKAVGSGHPEAALLARFNLAKISESEGDYEWAIHYFKEVVELDEKHEWATPWAAYNAAVLLLKQGDAWLVAKAHFDLARRLGQQYGNAEVVAKAERALDAFPG